MEKKQYDAPVADVLSNTFEDIIVASGEPAVAAKESIALKTDVFGE